jgi:5-methylcytosine-specific restriction endonuclease McrA
MAKRTDLELPGGAKIQLRGYLPDKTCRARDHIRPAGMFLKPAKSRRGKRLYEFDPDVCCWCAHRQFPRDLLPMQLTGTFVTDDCRCVGWRERTKAGPIGPELPLESMQFRLTADGVVRPQPKFDRRKGAQPTSRDCAAVMRDPQRCFTKAEILAALGQQNGRCPVCDRGDWPGNPWVGGHNWPHSRGGSTAPKNCIAVHKRCNQRMSDMTLEEYREWEASRRPLFRDI